MEDLLKISYYDGAKSQTKECENPEKIRNIMKLRFDLGNGCSEYNYFYFSENGSGDDQMQLMIEANKSYAYLFFTNKDGLWQSLNDNNGLDLSGETTIIPEDPVSHSNAYFVTIEAAINSAIEFCKTKNKPTNIRWESMFEEL